MSPWLQDLVSAKEQVVAAEAEGQLMPEKRRSRVNVVRRDLEAAADVAGQADLSTTFFTFCAWFSEPDFPQAANQEIHFYTTFHVKCINSPT